MAIFSDVFNSVDETVMKLTSSNIQNVMSALEPLLLSCFSVYLLFLFLSYWNGSAEDSIVDFLKKVIAWFVVLAFSLNIGNYNEYVLPIVLNLGDGLSQTFSGSGEEVQSSIDTIIDTAISSMETSWQEISSIDLAGQILFIIAVFTMLPALLLFLTMSIAYLMLAKIFCAILAVLGPIFISFALFPATRQFFSAWINQVVTYSLLTLILNIFVGLFVGFMIREIGDMTLLAIPTSINVAVMSIIFFVLLLRVPDLASALGNGLSMNGFTQAARLAMTGGKGAVAGATATATGFKKLKDKFKSNGLKPEKDGK